MRARFLAVLIGLAAGGLVVAALDWRESLRLDQIRARRGVADDRWAECGLWVAHAFGGVDSVTYTNSLEAFQLNYGRGFRVFEVDFLHTRDGALVAAHDWDTPDRHPGAGQWPDLAEFRRSRINGRYSPLAATDVARLMAKYPDVWIVLDFKEGLAAALPELVREVRLVDSALLNRLIPQIWDPAELELVLDLHPFPSVIWTLYASSASDRDILRQARRAGIGVVTLSTARFNPSLVRRLRAAGIAVYVHTVNTVAEAVHYRARGASGVYTDFLIANHHPGGTRCMRLGPA